MYAHFLFEAFDTNNNGSVSFEVDFVRSLTLQYMENCCQMRHCSWFVVLLQDFVVSLSIILRGSITDKLNWAFNLYDLNKDGCITREVTAPPALDSSAPQPTASCNSSSCSPRFCSPGDDGHHALHLRHDGEVHLPQHEGQRSQGARRQLFPGEATPPPRLPHPPQAPEALRRDLDELGGKKSDFSKLVKAD